MPGSNSNSGSNSSSNSSNSSAGTAATRATTAKNKKAAEKARMVAKRANAASVRNNVTAKFAKLPAGLRKQAQDKLKEIRVDSDLGSDEKAEAEAKLFGKIQRALDKVKAQKEAEKAAKAAETAAKRNAAKSARSAATAAKKAQKEANLARAKGNLKNYLGESPLKKHVNAFYKARQNTAGMTAKNYAKAAGLHRTRKLTESAKKLQKKQKSVAADFVAKGVDGEEFCEKASAYLMAKEWLEKKHKEAGLKHSLATITDVCTKELVATPEGSGSA
jgi:hypothetical protein